MAAAVVAMPGDVLEAISRPQIGIDRLPIRRSATDSKEAMNCKSCRKRKVSRSHNKTNTMLKITKIKCNRLKPSCEACQVFNCACIYGALSRVVVGIAVDTKCSDAVPKKRGPKTDVLEALLKRVNGLEERLKDEKKAESESVDSGEPSDSPGSRTENARSTQTEPQEKSRDKQRENKSPRVPPPTERIRLYGSSEGKQVGVLANSPSTRETIAFTDALLDTYFARLHNKPYYILDEANTRQRLRDGQLPKFMINAIHAVSIRYVQQLCGGYTGAVRASQDYATQSRAEIDVDEPSIDHLQALLLLAMANFQSGKGKKAYMLLGHAISMAFALGLHRELPTDFRCSSIEREGRRNLFWTCYLMDRFTTSGSKRPPLILDESIYLRFPAWKPSTSHKSVEGNYFPNGSSLPFACGVSTAGQGSGAMLVEIVRILGATNKYLAAGGVKGDSHFPWHVQSTLSRIRLELDHWGDSTKDAFQSIETLFGQQDSMTLILSKLVYHLIHCLLYRPFLPVDLNELQSNREEQPWQIEATNLCFMHANAIAELVEIGKGKGISYWPSFVGFCVCTAGTIHVHGAHYISLRDGDVFGNSADFLARETAQLSDLRWIWAGVQHQLDTLRVVYASHSQLVQALACSPMRFSPVFQMEDFFDRYPGAGIDGSHITLTDVTVEESRDSFAGIHDDFRSGVGSQNYPQLDVNSLYQPVLFSQPLAASRPSTSERRAIKRRRTTNGVLHPYPTPTIEFQHDPFDRRRSDENRTTRAPQQRLPTEPLSTQNEGDGLSISVSYENDTFHDPTLAQSAFSPTFTFSPMPQHFDAQRVNNHDPFYGAQSAVQSLDHLTPSGTSASAISASATIEEENDPFLSFLQQLAENEGSGGPHELDFFLNGGHDSAFEDGVV